MSLVRLLARRFWFCLGLAMVLAGATAATVGYVAARESRARASVVITPAPAVKAAKPQPVKPRTTAKRTVKKNAKRPVAAPTTQATVAETRRRLAAATVARNAVAAASAPPAIPVPVLVAPSKWRGVMWWGGGAFVVGLASVAYSLYERPPKLPTSGADELLNDAPPF